MYDIFDVLGEGCSELEAITLLLSTAFLARLQQKIRMNLRFLKSPGDMISIKIYRLLNTLISRSLHLSPLLVTLTLTLLRYLQ